MNILIKLFINVFFIYFIFHQNLYSKKINFHAWGGSVVINNFISQASQNLKKNNIDLRHTKITDIAETVKILLSDKKNNNLLYTYIKSDWIPHITIGQIRDKKYAEQFANEKYKIEIFLNRLSYIKYENKKHITLKEKKYC